MKARITRWPARGLLWPQPNRPCVLLQPQSAFWFGWDYPMAMARKASTGRTCGSRRSGIGSQQWFAPDDRRYAIDEAAQSSPPAGVRYRRPRLTHGGRSGRAGHRGYLAQWRDGSRRRSGGGGCFGLQQPDERTPLAHRRIHPVGPCGGVGDSGKCGRPSRHRSARRVVRDHRTRSRWVPCLHPPDGRNRFQCLHGQRQRWL